MLVFRSRSLRHRGGNIPVRVLRPGHTRWTRGRGVWVANVFAWRGSPAAWTEDLVPVDSVQIRAATPSERKPAPARPRSRCRRPDIDRRSHPHPRRHTTTRRRGAGTVRHCAPPVTPHARAGQDPLVHRVNAPPSAVRPCARVCHEVTRCRVRCQPEGGLALTWVRDPSQCATRSRVGPRSVPGSNCVVS